MVQSERYREGRVSIERRHYITSVDDIDSFRHAVRGHWGIENGLHWRLDVTFREHESRIRRGNAPHKMGVIRHVAMNLLKGEASKISVRKQRIRAGFSDDFRDKILMGRWFYMRLPWSRERSQPWKGCAGSRSSRAVRKPATAESLEPTSERLEPLMRHVGVRRAVNAPPSVSPDLARLPQLAAKTRITR